MRDAIDAFIEALSNFRNFDNVQNLYLKDCTYGEIRRDNLRRYLHGFIENQSKIIVVGEGPDYNGCALTGILLRVNMFSKIINSFQEEVVA